MSEVLKLVEEIKQGTSDPEIMKCQLDEAAKQLERLVVKCDRQANILRHTYAETLGNIYFICGEIGEKDEAGLPNYIIVCPAYGADWTMTYKKDGKANGPEW
jgi:hypothetical protein